MRGQHLEINGRVSDRILGAVLSIEKFFSILKQFAPAMALSLSLFLINSKLVVDHLYFKLEIKGLARYLAEWLDASFATRTQAEQAGMLILATLIVQAILFRIFEKKSNKGGVIENILQEIDAYIQALLPFLVPAFISALGILGTSQEADLSSVGVLALPVMYTILYSILNRKSRFSRSKENPTTPPDSRILPQSSRSKPTDVSPATISHQEPAPQAQKSLDEYIADQLDLSPRCAAYMIKKGYFNINNIRNFPSDDELKKICTQQGFSVDDLTKLRTFFSTLHISLAREEVEKLEQLRELNHHHDDVLSDVERAMENRNSRQNQD